MGRFVTCNSEIVWKYVFGEQSSELYRVPAETGAGRHTFIKIDQERVLEDGTIEWVEVDPNTSEFDAELLRIGPDDLPALRQYAEDNTPSVSTLQKLFGKKVQTDHFVSMITAIADYAEGKGELELLGEL